MRVTSGTPERSPADTWHTGLGYYLLGADGGVFAYGSAEFKGSTGDIELKAQSWT